MSRKDWSDDKLITRLISNKTDKSYWQSIHELRKRASDELYIKCVDLTKSKVPKTKTIGIEILAQFGLPSKPYLKQTIDLYFELLESEKDPEVLMSLLYSIGHNNDKLKKEQIKILCSFYNNDNSLVREGLVFSLLGIENPLPISTLIKLSSDKLSHIRNWATFGLGTQIKKNNKNIREALWNRVKDKHQETKLEAILGLAKRSDSRVKEVIKREIITAKYGTLLFEAILETMDKSYLPLLRQNLKDIQNDSNVNPEWKKDLKNCIDELNV